MDELRERAKGYIQMEEMSIFQNEVCQAAKKRNKREAHTKADLHKSDKRYKPASPQKAQIRMLHSPNGQSYHNS